MSAPPPVLLKLLDHPTRRAILRIVLEDGAKPQSPKELAEQLQKELGTVAYHVRTLAKDDALELVRTKPRRGSREHFYVPGALVQAHPEVVAVILNPQR
jgi:DNA-binding transcriptional ArsR family regulator